MDATSAPRRWLIIAVLGALMAGCATGVAGSDAATSDAAPAGNAARFCALWPDTRPILLRTVSGEESFDLIGDESIGLDKFIAARELAIEEADAAVPAELRDPWNTVHGAFTSVVDLLFTTGYSDLVLRPTHFTLVFGDRPYDATIADTQRAVAAIDDWAVEMCGDFCSRWAEFEDILRYEPNFDWRWQESLDRMELALVHGDRLVPDAIRTHWDIAVDIQRRRMAMFRDGGFGLNVDEETALARWGVIPWDEAQAGSDGALDMIQTWAEDNCDASAITGGAPGRVNVRYPLQSDLTGLTLVTVLLPQGTNFADVRSLDQYLAVWCTLSPDFAPDARIEDIPSDTLRPIDGQGEYFSSDLCNLIRHEEAAVMAGGVYELFVGAFVGGPGAYGLYFAAPQWCIQVPVGVDGTTSIDIPPLEPCNLEPVGSAEEIARRTPPPSEGDSRLWIEVTSAMGRQGYDFCRMDAYLLPAGTTLNEIGRGDVWPAAAVNFHPASYREIEGQELTSAQNPGRVPMLAMPPSGTGEVIVSPMFRPDGPWDSSVATPVPLPAGSYDLRITEWCARDEEGGVEGRWCATETISVSGDTVVPMPELGECP